MGLLYVIAVALRDRRRVRESSAAAAYRRAFDRRERELLVVVAGQAADANRADPPAVLEDGDAAEEEGEEGIELARSTGSSRAFSASSRVDVASLRAAV